MPFLLFLLWVILGRNATLGVLCAVNRWDPLSQEMRLQSGLSPFPASLPSRLLFMVPSPASKQLGSQGSFIIPSWLPLLERRGQAEDCF